MVYGRHGGRPLHAGASPHVFSRVARASYRLPMPPHRPRLRRYWVCTELLSELVVVVVAALVDLLLRGLLAVVAEQNGVVVDAGV